MAVIAISLPLFALDVPALKGHVNDYAGMFKPATVSVLENELADFENKESTQIVVLTVPSLQGEVLEEFSMKVAEKWRLGQKKLDNGVILFISKEDRKIRIEVGYGLEGRLTDLYAGRIIDNNIKPAFKAGQYDEGILVAARCIEQAVKGEYPGMKSDPNIDKPFWTESTIIMFCVFGGIGLIVLIIVILAIKFPAAFASSGGGSSSSDSGSSYSSGSSSSSDSSSSSSSSSSDSYSGGGGSFGGGGASGDW
jgi:uncharacterized protein